MARAVLAVLTLSALCVGPAAAQTAQGSAPVLDRAANGLRSDPVYVDDQAERKIDGDAADRLRKKIRESGQPTFVALLPAAVTTEVGGNANGVPEALARRVGLAGTYAVVAGRSFRAGSTTLPTGSATAAATAAFQAHSGDGVDAVLDDFVDRVSEIGAGSGDQGASGNASSDSGGSGGSGGSGEGGGGGSLLPLVLILGAGGAGLYFWQRGKRRREEAEEAAEEAKDRSLLQAELSVLAEDVLALEPQLALHPDARADYDAGVARYRAAQAALEAADDRIDLVRVERVIAEGRYGMDRARAIIDGRPPPPPPSELARRGRHQEPAVDLDDEGRPQYVGYGEPFYGGGWFGGGGGGLLTGLFLGSMLGGWGGGGHHEQNVHVEDSGDGGGGDWGGGDWGGGGDFGGDFGGGDVGGGDF
jgi:hypothetical protein